MEKLQFTQMKLLYHFHFKWVLYWGIDTLLKIKPYIDPAKNIIEIGGHCGTSSLVYASFLNDDQKIYVYEPQKKCSIY